MIIKTRKGGLDYRMKKQQKSAICVVNLTVKMALWVC